MQQTSHSKLVPTVGRCPAARLCVALRTIPSCSASSVRNGPQDTGGRRVAIECSAWPKEQTTLHVQSVSRWAPSNIGPYSQAKTVGTMVLVSGQIALDPATMSILADSPQAQTHQCIRNLQVVSPHCNTLQHTLQRNLQVVSPCTLLRLNVCLCPAKRPTFLSAMSRVVHLMCGVILWKLLWMCGVTLLFFARSMPCVFDTLPLGPLPL